MLQPDRALTPAEAAKAAALLKALAEPSRLQLVALLATSGSDRALTLLQLLTVLNRGLLTPRQPTIAHHLKVLSGAGLVRWALNPDAFCRAAAIVRGVW